MSIQHANLGIVKNNLQLYYNREFSKSFRGEATTNLIGTYGDGAVNAYPSSGNGWGTYYARNPYGSGAFTSIGTIASVSSNIITVSSPTGYFNGLATYDVIRPQTTGGGVTANTDYYFKRLSSTTFTLHAYDGTNDASKTVEQILSSIASDTRISVNSTSFPTVWWGYPHLPNSALIKTTVRDGFCFDNRFHDCMRLNWFRSDATDGMAYGVAPTYSANTQYTFSCYIRASSQNSIGSTINFSLYFTGTGTGGGAFYSPTLTDKWQKWTQTFTSSGTGGVIFFYFWCGFTTPGSVDISELQFEQKSYATEFAATSRSANTVAGGGGLLDVSGNSINADLSNVSFDSSGFIFNGTSNYIPLSQVIVPNSSAPYTVSAWVYRNRNNGGYEELLSGWTSANSGNSFFFGFNNSNIRFTDNWNDVTVSGAGNTGVWMNLVGVYTTSNAYIYLNGALAATKGSGFSYTGTGNFIIGRQGELTSEYFSGKISNVMVYYRALTSDEVLRNFNSQRATYGI